MTIYNPKSLKAEEFINDAEIRETLAYAEKNKGNAALIDEILEKARPRKTETGTVCRGLSHREASVLLACEIPEKVQEIYRLAEEIKLAFYGNRIVMFAPLYLSNYCVNGCLYCPYHLKNNPPPCGHRPPLRPHGLLLEADSGVALGAAEHTQGRLTRQGPAERFPRGFSSQGRKNHYICSAWHDSDIPPKGGF